MAGGSVPRIPLQVSRGCVVASIQVELTDEVLQRFRGDLLQLVESSGAAGVILELSGVEIIDLGDFDALRQTMSMAAIMGARPIVAGLRPGVVSSLVSLGAHVDDIEAALNLDDAFQLLSAGATGDDATGHKEPTDESNPHPDTHRE